MVPLPTQGTQECHTHSQVGRLRLSPCELNKFSLKEGQAEGGQGSLRQAIMYANNNKSTKQGLKPEKQIQHGVKINISRL